MANPNNVFKNMPKRPFEHVAERATENEAEQLKAAIKAEGYDVKVTMARVCKDRVTKRWRYTFNIWKREAVK